VLKQARKIQPKISKKKTFSSKVVMH